MVAIKLIHLVIRKINVVSTTSIHEDKTAGWDGIVTPNCFVILIINIVNDYEKYKIKFITFIYYFCEFWA